MKISDLQRKIYIDMDGVLVFCTKSAASFNNLTVKEFLSYGYGNKYWDNFVAKADLYQEFANMGWESNGKRLLNFFNQRNIPYTFLTRPIKEPHTKECIKGKLSWLMKNSLDEIPVLFERHKEKYVGNGNILIDDDSRNIDAWNESGGIGILYRNEEYELTIKKLEKLLK